MALACCAIGQTRSPRGKQVPPYPRKSYIFIFLSDKIVNDQKIFLAQYASAQKSAVLVIGPFARSFPFLAPRIDRYTFRATPVVRKIQLALGDIRDFGLERL